MRSRKWVTLRFTSRIPKTSRQNTPFSCLSPSTVLSHVLTVLRSITDVIGHKFVNAQLIADQFAANGYFVFVPDLFYGDPIPLNRPGDFDLSKWLQGEYSEKKISHLPPVVDPIIDASLIELRTKYKAKV